MSITIEHFSLRLSDADPISFQNHVTGQMSALAEFGVDALARPGLPIAAPGSISLVHLVHAPTGRTAGGMAVFFRRDGLLLPSELNLADPGLSREIEQKRDLLPCELCGTWISKEFRKMGLLPYLFHGAIAAAHLGGARVNFSSAHEKSARAYEALGAAIDYTRVYPWPTKRYRTYIARIDIPALLASGTEGARTAIEIKRAFGGRRPFDFVVASAGEFGVQEAMRA